MNAVKFMEIKKLLKKVINNFRNTGERPILEANFEDINIDAQFSYLLASKKVSNKTVLDYGCGGGYGSEYLSRFTEKEVVGYDINRKTIEINSHFFSKIKNLYFTYKKNDLKIYDLIVSFQVIEHLQEDYIPLFLNEIKNYLTKSGIFLLATVNKNITSYQLKKSIFPFHTHEFAPGELEKVLKKYFPYVKTYGQTDEKTILDVKNGRFSYNKVNTNLNIKRKILRVISQFEIVRIIARHLPLFIKEIFFGNKNTKIAKQVLVDKPILIDNSYILIYECKK